MGRSRPLSLLLLVTVAGCAAPAARPPPPESRLSCVERLERNHAIIDPQALTDGARVGDRACRMAEPVRVVSLASAALPPVTMDCALAERLDRFLAESVEPAARRDLGTGVKSVRHFGAYACRLRADGHNRLSEHAFGLAIDISGFDFSDGSHADVARDWHATGPRGRFLRDVAHAACGWFSVVLSPDYNARHRDHLHFDLGPDKLCGVH